MSQPTVALIGLRGCGKSTVGRELAKLLGGRYVDTDQLIEKQAGRSIADIFAEEREMGFRRREREAVAEVVVEKPAVISLGGGAVLDERNVEQLRTIAVIVWLTAPAEVLQQRTSTDPATAQTRPSLTDREGLAEVEHLLAQRTPLYQRAADLTIDTTDRTPLDIARSIADQLTRDVE